MKRRRPEQAIQRAVCAHIRQRGVPGLVWWSTPNEGKRSPAAMAALMLTGLRPGVSDLCFVYRDKFYGLELKADRGRMSLPQMEFRDAINAAGGYATYAVGVDDAVNVLKKWGLIR